MRGRIRIIGTLAFALWLLALFLSEGIFLSDPASLRVVLYLSPTGRIVGLLRPYLTANYLE